MFLRRGAAAAAMQLYGSSPSPPAQLPSGRRRLHRALCSGRPRLRLMALHMAGTPPSPVIDHHGDEYGDPCTRPAPHPGSHSQRGGGARGCSSRMRRAMAA
jgi:hypothetical protein